MTLKAFKTITFFLLVLEIAAQDRIYFMDNTMRTVYLQSQNAQSVYYKLDTLPSAKEFSIDKDKIAIALRSNGERLIFKRKTRGRKFIEAAVVFNNSYSSYPDSPVETDNSVTKYTRRGSSFDPLPGAHLAYIYMRGTRPSLSFFISPAVDLAQNRIGLYNSTHKETLGINKKTEWSIVNVNCKLVMLYVSCYMGMHARLTTRIELDLGVSFAIQGPVGYRAEGYTLKYNEIDGTIQDKDSTAVSRHNIGNEYPYYRVQSDPGFYSTAKLCFDLGKELHRTAAVIGMNLYLSREHMPNYLFFGLRYSLKREEQRTRFN